MNSEFIMEMIPYFGQNERKDKFELMALFKAQKAKALALQQEINHTDKEIDRMVYELYELIEEKIRIVEGI